MCILGEECIYQSYCGIVVLPGSSSGTSLALVVHLSASLPIFHGK